jgi:hypothetical protein
VQNLVAMAPWLLGLEHLQIRKPPRPSKFFPVHHSSTSPPTSQYQTLTQQYNRMSNIKTGDPSPWVEPRTLPANGLEEAESYLMTVILPITIFPVFYETKRTHGTVHHSPPPTGLYPAHSRPPLSFRSILILSFHLRNSLPSGLFRSGFPTKTVQVQSNSVVTS